MPLPSPNSGETQDTFIGRCMGDEEAMRDFPEQEQRLGVCFTRWREVHGGEASKGSHGMFAIKTFGPLAIKDADRGEVEAVVSTFDVVDRDGDVILPGAIQDGTKVKISQYGHGAIFGDPPAGKGVLRVTGKQAILEGKFFMSTERGRETFHMLKELGADNEWSIGYWQQETSSPSEEWKAKGARRMIHKLSVFETSPVILAANAETWTVAVKESTVPPDDAAIAKAQEEAAAAAIKQAEEAKAAEEQAAIRVKELAELGEREFDRLQRTLRRFAR